MRNLPKAIKKTTLQFIAEEGIVNATSRRINGGGYNNLLIETKEAVYLVNPNTTSVLKMHTDRIVTVLEEHTTAVDFRDVMFMEKVETLIHKKDVSHYGLDITIAQCRPKQLTGADEAVAINRLDILRSLERNAKNKHNSITKVFSDGYVENNSLFVMVNETIDDEIIEFRYIYDLVTKELSKEAL